MVYCQGLVRGIGSLFFSIIFLASPLILPATLILVGSCYSHTNRVEIQPLRVQVTHERVVITLIRVKITL
jgi:hypothetical protein